MLFLLPKGGQALRRFILIVGLVLGSVLTVISVRSVATGHIVSPVSIQSYDPPACYQISHLDGDVIGDYWRVLSLNIYTDAIAIPTIDGVRPYPWLINNTSVKKATVKNVIIYNESVELDQLHSLPDPDNVIECSAYIYPDSGKGSDSPVKYKIYHFNDPINRYLGW